MPEIRKIRKNGTDYTLADETARAAAQDAREMAGYQADLVRMEMAQALAGKADAGVSYTKAESDAAVAAVQATAQEAQTAAEQVRVDVAAEITKRIAADEEINDRLNLLWELNEGISYDFVERVENGVNAAPKGAVRESLMEAYGRTWQDGIPSPDAPKPIHSVERLNIKHTDGDGTVIDEREVVPPRSLNSVGNHKDVCDVIGGNFIYNNMTKTIPSEDWKEYGIFLDQYLYYFDSLPGVLKNQDTANFICSHCAAVPNSSVNVMENGQGRVRTDGRIYINCTNVNSLEDFSNKMSGCVASYILSDAITEPIPEDDLAFLRSLQNIPATDKIIITDQDGNDVSYLVKYLRSVRDAL